MQSERAEENEFIGLKALFNKNMTSILFLIMFVFFTVFVLHIEIFLLQTEYDQLHFFCAIPIACMAVNFFINQMKVSFDNLNKFLMIGLVIMITLSTIHISLEYSNIQAQYIIFLILISQMAIYQKMFFMQIMIYLFKKFDVTSTHQQNQINGIFNPSAYESNPTHCYSDIHGLCHFI